MHAERLVVGDEHGLGRVPPFGRLPQVVLRHEVGVDIIIGDGAVLVWAGNAVDAEAAASVVVAQREPEPGSLYEQLKTRLALECIVAGGHEVTDDGGRDIGIDVKGGRASRPVL